MLLSGKMVQNYFKCTWYPANFSGTLLGFFVMVFFKVKLNSSGKHARILHSRYCQYRSPPSCQPALFCTRRYRSKTYLMMKCNSGSLQSLAFLSKRSNSHAIEEMRESRQKCLRIHGSSQSQAHLFWLAVLTMMQNALSSVQVLAPSRRISLVQTVLGQPSLELRLVCSATTQASVVKISILPNWAYKSLNRCESVNLAAVLRSKDPLHV